MLIILCGLCYCARDSSAFGWPSVDGYPAIERFLDPTFLSEDFYTNTTDAYGVDTPQAVFFGSLQRWTGISHLWLQAGLNFLRCLLFPWLLYEFFRVFSKNRRIALIGVVLGTLTDFSFPETIGWEWVWGDPSPAMFSVFIIMAGWICFLRRAPWITLLLLALSSFVHPLMTVHGSLLIALMYFFDYDRAERIAAVRSTANWVCGGLFAAAFGFQYVMLSPHGNARLDTEEYVNIVAYIRHPLDFIPSLIPLSIWIRFGVVALAVACMLFVAWRAIPRRRLLVSALVAYVMVCTAGYVFVELWPIRFFVQLIPLRSVMMGAPMLLLVMAVYVDTLIRDDRLEFIAVVMAAFFFASRAMTHRIPGAVGPSVLLIAVLGERLLNRYQLLPSFSARMTRRFGALMIAAVVLSLIAGTALAIQRRHADYFVPSRDSLHPVYGWIQDNTEPDAVFLVEQHSSSGAYGKAINPQLMRLFGRRAVVASKDFPFLDHDMKEWSERWKVALNNGQRDFVESVDVETLLSMRQRYPFDGLVRRSPLNTAGPSGIRQIARFAPSHGVGEVFVYGFSSQEASQ